MKAPTSGSYDPKRVAELAELLLRYKKSYYSGKPEISDAAFDSLEDELRQQAPSHPVLLKVGAEPASGAQKVKHDRPLLSLQKTYELTELISWMDGEEVVGTIKVDGNSLSVVYFDGKLQQAKTRGNGQVGEDVTPKVKWVAAVVPQLSVRGKVEVRGELYCTESQFMLLSEQMVKQGFERPNNPRNIVAGLLGRKGSDELMRYVSFFAFDLVDYEETLGFRSEMAKFAWLANEGFSLPQPELLKSPADVDGYLEKTKKLLEEDEVGLDGAVFSYNDLTLHAELGHTSHHPRFKMSFKWQGQTAEAQIKDVIWAVSRLGIVTPVAVIEPVYLSGAKITNITLHNAAHVKAYNLKVGDEIELVRSGEVIPKFLQVVKAAEGHYHWPERCSACGNPLVFDDVRLKCNNVLGCPAQQLGTILNWIRCAEIDDLSEKRLLNLMDIGLVKTIPDLYKLALDDFYKLPQTKERMAAKLYGNIQASKSLPLVRFLNGLGIEGAGLTTWEKLLDAFPSLEQLLNVTEDEVIRVEGFAEKSAGQIVQGLSERQTLIKALLAAGVTPAPPVRLGKKGGALSGKSIVITGALSQPREDIEAAIKAAGGKVASAVSKNTFAVVTEDPTSESSKMKKARSLGVNTWSEADLWAAIKS